MIVENHVILYLDLLGYSNIVRDSKENENSCLNIVYSLMTDLQEFINEWKKESSEADEGLHLSRIESCLFSDNIVIFAPYENDNDKLNLAMNILYCVGEFLFQYDKSMFLFRGSLTAGKLFYDSKKHFIFGSGLVRAAGLEKEAEFPKIKIDTCAIGGLITNINAKSYQSILIGIGVEEKREVYFDYLRYGYCVAKDVVEPEEITGILNNEKKIIETALRDYSGDPRVYKKYLWLANYHNQFCTEKLFTDYIVKIE